jgi:hypothetical protein
LFFCRPCCLPEAGCADEIFRYASAPACIRFVSADVEFSGIFLIDLDIITITFPVDKKSVTTGNEPEKFVQHRPRITSLSNGYSLVWVAISNPLPSTHPKPRFC